MSSDTFQLKPSEITQLIGKASEGDDLALNQLIPVIYPDLKLIAAGIRYKHHVVSSTLNTTALVNEAWIKLKTYGIKAENRKHFFCITAKAMRHIIINKIKAKAAKKREGQVLPIQDSDKAQSGDAQWMLQLEKILISLENNNKRLGDVFQLKYFLGMREKEIAALMSITDRTVRRDWITVKKIISEVME